MARSTPYKVIRTTEGNIKESPAAIQNDIEKRALEEHERKLALQRPTVPSKGKVLTAMEMRSRILTAMADQNYDPIMELITMAKLKDVDGSYVYDAKMRKEIHAELAQYTAPKLKSTEVTVEGSGSLTITVRKFSETPGDSAKPVQPAAAQPAIEV